MTPEEIIEKVMARFPECPDPEQYPKTFEWYCKLYFWYDYRKQRYGIV